MDLKEVVVNFEYMSAYSTLEELCRIVGVDAIKKELDEIAPRIAEEEENKKTFWRHWNKVEE